MKKLFLLCIICLIIKCSAFIHDNNKNQYGELMPPKFYLDPYEACLSRPGALYCTVDAALVSDTPSPLLDMIQEYSANVRTHFNHTSITYGLCVTSTCKSLYDDTTVGLKATLEGCLNRTMNDNYGLKTRVTDNIYCNTGNEQVILDPGDYLVAGVLCVLALLNIVGSLYHYHCTSGKPGERIKFLLCFSIRNNWRKLVQPAEGNPEPRLRRLRAFNGIKVLTLMGVLLAHTSFQPLFMLDNPQTFEEMYRFLPYQFLINGTLLMQLFFVMSSFLLVYNLMIKAEERPLTWHLLPKAIALRWMRLTPPYAVVLAITSTFLRFTGSGPLWKASVMDDVVSCRSDWWLHLLYVNNYKDGHHCMLQSWYLAADMQLYIFGVILCLTLRTNRTRVVVLPIFFVIGSLLPSLHTYFQDLNGPIIFAPENTRLFFIWDKTFNNVYKRGHTNLPCYIMGMALGYLVYHWQSTGVVVKNNVTYRYLYWTMYPLGVLVVMTGKFFYADGPRLPLYLRVAFAGLSKPALGLLFAVIIVGHIYKFENAIRGFLEWQGWTTLARLSYGAYVAHMMFIQFAIGQQTTVYHFQMISLLQFYLLSLVVAFVIAIPLYLFVETPIYEMVKLFLGPQEGLSGKIAMGAMALRRNEENAAKSEDNGQKVEMKNDKMASSV